MQEGEPQFQNWGLQNVKVQGNEDSEDFLSLGKDLELRKEELVTGSSTETMGSCTVEFDNLTIISGVIEDNPSLGVVLGED